MRKHHVICRPERNKNPRDFHEKPDDELSRPAVHTQKVRAFTRVSDKDTILHTKDEYQTLYCSLWGSFNGCLFPHFLWELVFASALKKPEFWKSHCWSSGVHGDRHQLLGLTGSGWCLRNTFSPWVSLSLQEIPSVFLHLF